MSICNAFKARGVFARGGRSHLWGRIPEGERDLWKAANWQHLSAKSVQDELSQDVWKRCFTFTIVRNPFDRLVSYYEYSKQARSDPSSVQFGLPPLGSFEDWFDASPPRTQLSYIADDEGEILVDFIGRYESLEQDLAYISDRLRTQALELPRMNASKRGDYRAYYSDALKDKAEQRYQEDLEAFDYSF